MNSSLLKDANKILLFLILLFVGLYYAKNFLIPIAYAVILAMLLQPLRVRFEKARIHPRWATFFCVLTFFFILSALIFLIAFQVTELYNDLPEIQRNAEIKLEKLKVYLSEEWSITKEQQDKIFNAFSLEEQKQRLENIFTSFAFYTFDIFLIMVYVYVFLYFKDHFKRFILKLVPLYNNTKAKEIMKDSGDVAGRYLVGKLILTLFLIVIYAIGFFFIGIKYALFYAIIAGVLSVIPYVGNFIGGVFPFAMAVINKDLASGLAVIGLFFVVQIIETYIFEPLIVGKNVNLNPPFSILIIVLGGSVWGISGMILAIPYLGIMQIIFSYIDPLKPFAFLIGDTESWDENIVEKISKKFKK
ncbi:MAG: AI-2E family transporter [Candidatus Cyclobacteriaceae bacterium M2_1C_046]